MGAQAPKFLLITEKEWQSRTVVNTLETAFLKWLYFLIPRENSVHQLQDWRFTKTVSQNNHSQKADLRLTWDMEEQADELHWSKMLYAIAFLKI